MAKLILLCGSYTAYLKQCGRQPTSSTYDIGIQTNAEISADAQQKILEVSEFQEDFEIFTNSDNYFNGLRVAVATKLVDKSNLEVHFYSENLSEPVIQNPDLRGRFNQWPNGFFDQIENDLMKLM